MCPLHPDSANGDSLCTIGGDGEAHFVTEAVGAARPRIIRDVVVLPAALGP